jgi:hypothetical protein
MKIRLHRLLGALITITLVSACDAANPSESAAPNASLGTQGLSSPAVPSTPSNDTPQSSPRGPSTAQVYSASGEIDDVLFAPDGRIVVVEHEGRRSLIVTLDESGRTMTGWPWSEGATAEPAAAAALGADASVYIAVRRAEGVPLRFHWTLHRLDAAGREMPGFPIKLADARSCEVSVAPDGSACVACQSENEWTRAATTEVRVVRSDGTTAPGWPIAVVGSASVKGFRRPDGATVLAVSEPPTVTVVLRTGETASGWPRSVAKGAGISIDASGRVRLTSWAVSDASYGNVTRTTYMLLGLDGEGVPGWPISVDGWWSSPLETDDGSMTVVSDRYGAYRYRGDGSIADGWPVEDVPVSPGSMPVDAGSGDVVVVATSVSLVEASGRVADGWPVELPPIAMSCPDCAGGTGGPLDPAVGEEAIHVATYREKWPQLVTLTRDHGGPHQSTRLVGAVGDTIRWLRIAPSGGVWMLLDRSSDETRAIVSTLVPVAQDVPIPE